MKSDAVAKAGAVKIIPPKSWTQKLHEARGTKSLNLSYSVPSARKPNTQSVTELPEAPDGFYMISNDHCYDKKLSAHQLKSWSESVDKRFAILFFSMYHK